MAAVILSCLTLLFLLIPFASPNVPTEYHLMSNEVFKIKGANDLVIVCNPGRAARFYYLWHSLAVNISLPLTDDIYGGPNASTVKQKYVDNNSRWFSLWNLLWKLVPGYSKSQKNTLLQIEAFTGSCIGFVAYGSVDVNAVFKFELIYAAFTIFGIVLFSNSKRLSQNIAFYYTCGISVSLLASLLILIVMIHRVLPMRRFIYILLTLGGAFSALLWSKVFSNIEVLLVAYSTYVIIYLITMGLLGFSLIYWYGPPENSSRTVVLVKWFIRLAAVLMVVCSVQIPLCSVVIVGMLFMTCIFNPTKLIRLELRLGGFREKLLCRYYRLFPPQRKYIPASEYSAVLSENTRTALSQLRAYCRSPECNSWEVIGRLKSPNRLASFVSNGSHIPLDEKRAFESMLLESDDSDNSDSSIEWANQENISPYRAPKMIHSRIVRNSTPKPLALNESYNIDDYLTDEDSDD